MLRLEIDGELGQMQECGSNFLVPKEKRHTWNWIVPKHGVQIKIQIALKEISKYFANIKIDET